MTQKLTINKEVMDYIERDGSRVSEDLECIAWNQYIQGKAISKFQKLRKSPKSIDNAIQNKRKLLKFKYNNRSDTKLTK